MKIQLLPSTFDENGCPSPRQHLLCLVVDDCVAIDAGSLAMATNREQKKQIRDVVLTHAHLDHIAGLPLFIDDLFANLTEPIKIFATEEVVEILETDIFNWNIYPRFSELENQNGKVLKYEPFEVLREFFVKHLRLKAIEVNHKVPAVGFVISDNNSTFAITGDTTATDEFWEILKQEKKLNALLIECAFPDEFAELAQASHHLTPTKLQTELMKFNHHDCPVYVINIKPMYFNEVSRQIENLNIANLKILQVGKTYEL